MSEFSRRGALLIGEPAMAPPPLHSVRRRARRYQLRRRLQAGVAACAAAAALAAVVSGVTWASGGAGPSPQPQASAGPVHALPAVATAPVPRGPAGVQGKPGSWRLASYISEPLSWSRGNAGPPAGGQLSCPQAGTCYFAGSAGGGSPSGPAPALSVLYVSGDGGLSWTALRMPSGVSFTTALACPAAGDCLAGGEAGGQAVLLSSSDGGFRWSYRPLPSGDGVIEQLLCPTLADCRALASSLPATASGASEPAWFLATDDAGASWTGYRFPDGAAMQALSCLNAADCVAVGGYGASRPQPPTELRTTDGGRTWTAASLPAGLTFTAASPGSVACAGTSTCYALGLVQQRYVPPAPVKGPGGTSSTTEECQGPASFSSAPPASPPRCVPPKYIEVSGVAVSTDGGSTWRVLALPPGTPQPSLSAISCPSAADCWVAGEQAVPQTIPGSDDQNGGSAMILATSDGGATWSKTTFAAGRLAPGQQADSFMMVGEIACPAAGSCAAVGVADQGSDAAPVYTTSGG
jgi:hypothetical protein